MTVSEEQKNKIEEEEQYRKEFRSGKTYKKWYQKTSWIIALLILFFPVGLFLMWRYSKWSFIIKAGVTILCIFFVFGNHIFGSASTTPSTNQNSSSQTQNSKVDGEQKMQQSNEFPSLSKETINRNFVFSCEGGDTVTLWDKPTDAAGGTTARAKVACGTFGWTFNTYYNEELKVTFYAVNTNDKNVKNAYGWITEDLLSWRE